MSPYASHPQEEPAREALDQMTGPVLLEFGAEWCPYCQAIQPHLKALLDAHPDVQHIKVEDGRGKPLGRSFLVKVWPTLVLLRDGQPLEQLTRPSTNEIKAGFAKLTTS
ncbi:MAG: thioredoxin family protein [Planctomycetes bacterium]|nr:thioredoxin family protein [Planctomycetota bacterium]